MSAVLALRWSKRPPELTLGWHDLAKITPVVLSPELDLTRVATIIAVAPASTGYQSTVFNQVSAQPTWIIPHNFNKIPVITITDLSGNLLEANIIHLDHNTAQVDFTVAVSGFAYLYA